MALFNRSARTPEFVMTDGGWRPFEDVIADAWTMIAATGWAGYQAEGRGFVSARFNPTRVVYYPLAKVESWLNSSARVKEFRGHCSGYKPEREVLLMVEGCARNAKEARAGVDHTEVLSMRTPPGLPDPPLA